jgi:hypothetical protein
LSYTDAEQKREREKGVELGEKSIRQTKQEKEYIYLYSHKEK